MIPVMHTTCLIWNGWFVVLDLIVYEYLIKFFQVSINDADIPSELNTKEWYTMKQKYSKYDTQ